MKTQEKIDNHKINIIWYVQKILLSCIFSAFVLVLIAQLIGFFGEPYSSLNISILSAVLISLVAFIVVPDRQNFTQRYKWIVGGVLGFIALISISLVSHALVSGNHGWDVSTVDDIARTYVIEGRMAPEGDWNEQYLAKYENNVPIVVLLITVYKVLGSIFGEHYTAYSQVINTFVLLASFAITVFLAYRLFGLRASLLAYILGFVLIILSAYMPITYTDTIGMFFVSVALLFIYFINVYRSTKLVYLFVFLLGGTLFLGYLVKPTIIFIAVSAIMALLLTKRFKWFLKPKRVTGILLFCMAGIILASGAYTAIRFSYGNLAKYPESVLEQNATPLEHFLGMGSLRGLQPYEECRKGAFCGDYVDYMQSGLPQIDTIRERKDYAIGRWTDSVKQGFPWGYSQHLLSKMTYVYSDGSFGVWGEAASEISDINFYNDSAPDEWVRSLMGPAGKNLAVYRAIQNGVWIAILLMITIGVATIVFTKNRNIGNYYYVFFLGISIALVTLFLMLFEARPRYLFLYLPVFILLSVSFTTIFQQKILKFLNKVIPNKAA